MKIIKPIIYLIVIAGLFVFNSFYLKIKLYYFIGMILALLLAYVFLANFVVKIYKSKKGLPQEKHAYAFPDKVAKAMKKIDMRTQMEAGLLSMFFIVVGMLAMDIYIIFFTSFDWWFKSLALVNSFFGMLFLISSMIGQYQSYVIYMDTMEALGQTTATTVPNQMIQEHERRLN